MMGVIMPRRGSHPDWDYTLITGQGAHSTLCAYTNTCTQKSNCMPTLHPKMQTMSKAGCAEKSIFNLGDRVTVFGQFGFNYIQVLCGS